jgi:hypothetical protein
MLNERALAAAAAADIDDMMLAIMKFLRTVLTFMVLSAINGQLHLDYAELFAIGKTEILTI